MDDFVNVERPDDEPPNKVVVEAVTLGGPADAAAPAAADASSDAADAANVAALAAAPDAAPDAAASAPPAGDELNAANLEQHERAAEGNEDDNAAEGAEAGGDGDGDGDSDKKDIPSSTVGAGLLFGLSGLVLGGPLLALVAGTGAVVVADPKNDTKAGEVARKGGDFVIENGEKVGQKAKEVDEEYGVLDKIKDAFARGWTRVLEFDEEHKVSEKTKEVASDVGAKTREFEEKHHWGEKFLGGVRSGVDFLMEKLKGGDKEGSCGDESCGGGNQIAKA